MKLPRRRSWKKLARKRGLVAIDEMLSTAALLACFAGPIAVAARSVGPQLASDMDHRIHEISAQQPRSSAPTSAAGDGSLDFGAGEGELGSMPRTPKPQLTTGDDPSLVGQP